MLRYYVAACLAAISSSIAAAQADLVVAVEPILRTSYGSEARTFLYAIINNGDEDATSCEIRNFESGPVVLSFFEVQLVNGSLSGLGAQNAAFDIPAGETRYLVYSVVLVTNPGARVNLSAPIMCDNAQSDPRRRLSMPVLSYQSGPTADIIATTATLSGDQVIRVGTEGGAMRAAVAAVNIGVGDGTGTDPSEASVTVRPEFTYHANHPNFDAWGGVPIELDICQTNPVNGQCLAPFAPELTTLIGNQPVTFSFRVRDNTMTGVRFNPADVRVGVVFANTNNSWVGLTTAAVTTPWADSRNASAADFVGIYRVMLRSTNETPDGSTPPSELDEGMLYVLPDGRVWLWWTAFPNTSRSPYWQYLQGELVVSGDCGQERICATIAMTGHATTDISVFDVVPGFEGQLSGSAALGSFVEGLLTIPTIPVDEAETGFKSQFGIRTQYLALNRDQSIDDYVGDYVVFDAIGLSRPNAVDGTHLSISANGAISGFVGIGGSPACTYSGTVAVPPSKNFPPMGSVVLADCGDRSGETVEVILTPDGTGSGNIVLLMMDFDSLTTGFLNAIRQ